MAWGASIERTARIPLLYALIWGSGGTTVVVKPRPLTDQTHNDTAAFVIDLLATDGRGGVTRPAGPMTRSGSGVALAAGGTAEADPTPRLTLPVAITAAAT